MNCKFAEEVQQGPHQHSIFLAGRHDQKRVDAILRLFGGLSYFVVLSDSYAGADFNKTLVYDGYRRAEDGILFSHIDTQILQLENRGFEPANCMGRSASVGKVLLRFPRTRVPGNSPARSENPIAHGAMAHPCVFCHAWATSLMQSAGGLCPPYR